MEQRHWKRLRNHVRDWGHAHFQAWAVRSMYIGTWIQSCRHCHGRVNRPGNGLEFRKEFCALACHSPPANMCQGHAMGKAGQTKVSVKTISAPPASLQRLAAQNRTHWLQIDQETWSLQRKHVRHPGITLKEWRPLPKLSHRIQRIMIKLCKYVVLNSQMALCCKLSWII